MFTSALVYVRQCLQRSGRGKTIPFALLCYSIQRLGSASGEVLLADFYADILMMGIWNRNLPNKKTRTSTCPLRGPGVCYYNTSWRRQFGGPWHIRKWNSNIKNACMCCGNCSLVEDVTIRLLLWDLICEMTRLCSAQCHFLAVKVPRKYFREIHFYITLHLCLCLLSPRGLVLLYLCRNSVRLEWYCVLDCNAV
jgi:hypothetical protein